MNPVHWISNHVITCVLILVFVYMVLFRGLSRNNGGGGFMKIVALILFVFAAFAYFVQKTGSAGDMIPGFGGTVAQGGSSGMDANRVAYDKCLTNAVIAAQLVPKSQQFCSNMQSLPDWEKCMGGTVLCSQGGDEGCLRKTQCDAKAEGSIPENLLKGIVRAILTPLVNLTKCT